MATAVPVAWGASGLEVVLQGMTLGPSHAAPTPVGSARSRDGKKMAIGTQLGVLILGERPPLLLQPKGIDPRALSECVVADDGQRAACIYRQRAVLLTVPSRQNAR